jgi:predicted MPP superfamily phosphohydrolase
MAQDTAAPNRQTLRSRKVFAVALAVLLAACALIVDSIWIEPNWIEVTHSEIHGAVAKPLKIAHLSDIHTNGFGRRERRMLELLEEEKPDLIVVTGDTLATNSGNYDECRQVYEKLHAPLGVWVVRGNWENWRPVRHEHSFYESAGVHLLVNASQPIRPDVWLIGLDDPFSGIARLDTALAGVPRGVYTIALFHSPFYFDLAAGQVNLCLTGHTHGGQVRIPFLDPLWLPGGCGRYIQGWYEENGSQMYVSRGLGMSILPIRFLCRPELAIITVKP